MFVPGCVSCDILSGKRPSPGGVIYEDACWHVDCAARPVVWKGFLIVKLKRHSEHLAELTTEEALSLGPIIQSTCQALAEVMKPAKIYVCSFGEGTRHIHFWILPRPPDMPPGMHPTLLNLDFRLALTKLFGIQRWVLPDHEIIEMAENLRQKIQTKSRCQQ